MTGLAESVDDDMVEPSPDVDDADQDTPTTGADENDESEGPKGEQDKASKRRRWRRAATAAPNDGDDTARAPRRWIKSAIRWASAVVIIAVVAGAGYEGWLLFQQHQTDVAAAQARDAAQKYAVTLTSTDPNAVDQNFTDILNGATGDFKDQYTKASSLLRKALIENKVATQGSVLDSAVKSANPHTVEVLLFVQQSVSNSSNPEGGVEVNAITITMEKVAGRWLASKVVLPRQRR
jgi:Mce-associated membrane protein